MTELERLLSQDDSCLISVASVKRALKQDSKKEKHMQYMKYIEPVGEREENAVNWHEYAAESGDTYADSN